MMDLRTRAGRETEVVDQIREHGGFSVFWVTEIQARACAADRLGRRQRIVRRRDRESGYPWCAYEVIGG